MPLKFFARDPRLLRPRDDAPARKASLGPLRLESRYCSASSVRVYAATDPTVTR